MVEKPRHTGKLSGDHGDLILAFCLIDIVAPVAVLKADFHERFTNNLSERNSLLLLLESYES